MKQEQDSKSSLNKFFVPWMRRITIGLFGLILFLSLSGVVSFAQDKPKFPLSNPQQGQPTEPQKTVPPVPSAPGLNNPQEFKSFVDKIVNEEMSTSHVPGAVISVVKDGELFFAKGYAYANLEKKIPVVADKTLFRVASISKLFTATAAMQLYEEGKLELNGDVNKYLTDFQLKNPYPEPVTPARLMTHTDGTTQRLIGIAAREATKMKPLGEYLSTHMPPIVWRPGTLYSYSNHSIALLGYLVEKISGIPFVEYINKNIFQPLSMERSTFLQPPPPPLNNDLAVGYQYQDDAFTAFGVDNGQITFAFNPLWPKIGGYERIHWYETVWVQLGIAAFCTIVFLSAFIVWPIGYIFNLMRGKSRFSWQKSTFVWVVAGVVGTLNLLFLIGLPLSLWLVGWKLVYGIPTVIIALLCLPLITSVLSLLLLFFTIYAWKNNYWSWVERTHYSLITLAALIFIPFLAYWNLLGFQF